MINSSDLPIIQRNNNLSRRRILFLGSCAMAVTVSGCVHTEETKQTKQTRQIKQSPKPPKPPKKKTVRQPDNNLYTALPNERFPVPAIAPGKLKAKYQRHIVDYRTTEKPGTVIVDTSQFYLYHVLSNGKAMRYGVGLGRAGFAWSGRAKIAWKKKWPIWTPPQEMIARQPSLEKWSAENGGQPPGLNNALGARALYIHKNGKDTLYRLHGTSQVNSIGRAVSSGCVRLVNQDVIHLYDNVRSGSAIIVI